MALYQSLFNANLGNEPDTTPNAWTSTITSSTGSNNWVAMPGTMTPLEILYPLGSGPADDTNNANIFRLPNGFLRQADQNPKGGVPILGGPSGRFDNDWAFEGNYLVSCTYGPIVLRFVADMTYVPDMDAMFCEGLAARIGEEVCETLTQSTAKVQSCINSYNRVMGEARLVNGIEEGYTEPPEDDFINVRY